MQHILFSDAQFLHIPSIVQGVLQSSLIAFTGADISFTRFLASSASLTILFDPAITITSFGPKEIAATLFPLPSILNSSPFSVIAFVPVSS